MVRGITGLQAFFLLVATAAIIHGSLYPWDFDFARGHAGMAFILRTSWPADFDVFAVRDAIINLIFYFPLGLTLYLFVASKHTRFTAAVVALLAGLALSTGMELLQIYVPQRVCSLADILFNVIGTATGVLVAWRRQASFEAFFAAFGVWLEHPARLPAILLLGCWISYQIFPMTPQLKPGSWMAAIEYLQHPESLFAAEIWATTAEWFAVLLVFQAIARKGPQRWVIALILFRFATRAFILTRLFALDELLGATLAMLLWFALSEKTRWRAGLTMLTSAIALRQLSPFHFSHLPEYLGVGGVMFRKAFDYGIVVWLLCRAGLSHLTSGLVVLTSLGVFWTAHSYLSGTGPAAVDPILVAAMTLGLWLVSRKTQVRQECFE